MGQISKYQLICEVAELFDIFYALNIYTIFNCDQITISNKRLGTRTE